MMKKDYRTPLAEAVEIFSEDVIRTSSGLSPRNNLNGDDDRASLDEIFGS